MEQQKRKGLGGFDKILIGCGIGCAGIILIAVLGMAFGTMWFFTPGKQLPTDVIVGESSLGVIHLNEVATDPGTQELFTRVLMRIDEANRKQQREQLPESMKWVSDLQAQQSNPAGLNMFIPKEMTIAFEEAEDGGVDYVVAANPRTMVRMFKTMISLMTRTDDGDEVRSDFRGHAAYELEESAHLAFVHSTVLFASSRPALEQAIRRIEAGDVLAASAFTGAIPEGEWDIEGSVGNEVGLLESLLEGDEEIEEEDEIEEPIENAVVPSSDGLQLGFGFDVVTADEIVGRTILECGDRAAARQWRSVLEQRYQEMTERAVEEGLEVEIEVRTEGDRVVTEVRLSGVEQMIVEFLTVDEDWEEDWEDEVDEVDEGG